MHNACTNFDGVLECAPDGGQIAGLELTEAAGLSKDEDESHGRADLRV